MEASSENQGGGLATQAVFKGDHKQPLVDLVRGLKLPRQTATLALVPKQTHWKGTFEDIVLDLDLVIILAHPSDDLPGVRADATTVMEFFEAKGKKVVDMFHQHCDHDELLTRMTNLLRAHPNVFTYVAGHGTNDYTQNPREETGHDTSLQFGDFTILDDEFYGMLPNDSTDRQICFFFDTCNAGGFIDDIKLGMEGRTAIDPPSAPPQLTPTVCDLKPRGTTLVGRLLTRGAEFANRPPSVSYWDTVWTCLLDGGLIVSIALVVCLACFLVRAVRQPTRRGCDVLAVGVPLVMQVLGLFNFVSFGDLRVLSAIAGVGALFGSVVLGAFYFCRRSEFSTELVVRLARLCKISTDLNLILVSLLFYTGGVDVFMSVVVKGQRTLMFFPPTPRMDYNTTCKKMITSCTCMFEMEGGGSWNPSRKESFTKAGKDWIATCDHDVFHNVLKDFVGNDMSRIETFRVGNITLDIGKIQAEASSLMLPSTLNLQADVDERVKALLKQLENNTLGAILRPPTVSRGYAWDCAYLVYHGVVAVLRLLVGL